MRSHINPDYSVKKGRRKSFAEKSGKYYKSQIVALNVQDALKTGKLKRETHCDKCGISGEIRRIEFHHHDYSKPLEVENLCTQCHAFKHPEVAFRPAYVCPRCFGRTEKMWYLCLTCQQTQEYFGDGYQQGWRGEVEEWTSPEGYSVQEFLW